MAVNIAITFAVSALNDLRKMQAWYAEQGVPEIGERFTGEIIAKVETLQTYPDM